MANDPVFAPPAISDEDVVWACRAMGLPDHAFAGLEGNDPRLPVMKSMEKLDVEACPGSGKTTLLVAKLAILSNKWEHRRQGMCILSHTNAARNEIERRLGGCPAGRALLRYPHFVGTIHSFVNEFLALPWLRSRGYPIRAIDTEITLNLRWNKLPWNQKQYLTKRQRDKFCLVYARTDFTGGGLDTLGIKEQTTTYKELASILQKTTESGYFCHDEMFVWAGQLLDSHPHVAADLRARFPLVFLDEVQDNSELQSDLLYRIFFSAPTPALRQRFGDSNQAIFERPDQASPNTDAFPSDPKESLPNSFRFSQPIADAANPLGIDPQGLKGIGPSQLITAPAKHNTIFLFNDASLPSVLPAYAQYLLGTFSPHEIANGVYTAVAAVHRSGGTEKAEPPRSLKDYAPTYDPQINRKDSSPSTFLQYVFSGRREMGGSTDAHPLVSRTAAGVLRLAQMANPEFAPTRPAMPHRRVLQALPENGVARHLYLSLVDCVLTNAGRLSSEYWSREAIPILKQIAEAVAGCPATSSECAKFLEWSSEPSTPPAPHPTGTTDNMFRYPPADPRVNIRLGSIHSVKGETHTATLVLDSFHYKHHLECLKPWLLGVKAGGQGQKPRMLGRLRLHYVAMTRPSHLLCLAMRRKAVSAAEEATLVDRGWRIIECPAAGAT